MTRLQSLEVAPETILIYERFVRRFARWLAGYDFLESVDESGVSMPPTCPRRAATVVEFLVDAASQVQMDKWVYSFQTLKSWLAAINWDHHRHGYPAPGDDPAVKEAMKRLQAERPPSRVTQPLSVGALRTLLGHTVSNSSSSVEMPVRVRDHTLLLFAYAGAFLSTELVAMRFGDVHRVGRDLRVSVSEASGSRGHGAKLTQLEKGSTPLTCPPCAFTRWELVRSLQSHQWSVPEDTVQFDHHVCGHQKADADHLATDFLFPEAHKLRQSWVDASRRTLLNRVFKMRGEQAGLEVSELTARSLRVGFIVEALQAGASSAQIAEFSGHGGTAAVERIGSRNGVERASKVSVGL